MVSFTGCSETGKKIMAAASKTLKNVTLELGGPDLDIEKLFPQVAIGVFFNSGQLCVASKRIYVHRDISVQFVLQMLSVVKS
jgi:acyl-CoA reductase-like NAD-dependent aldehyde dehydrogenase